MGTTSGRNFMYGQGSLKLYELQGVRMGKNWAIGILLDRKSKSYLLTEVSPAPVRQEVEAVIQGDIKAGREQLIDYVLVSNRVAIRLYLEGFLKPSHFANAVEEEDGSIVVRAELLGKEHKIVIRDELDDSLEYEISTRDKEGNLV
jgi:hypothetical protein